MDTPRPNLFVIGAMKSATTYFSQLLGSHPSIFVSVPKEPCFFCDPELLRKTYPEAWERGFWRSLDQYLSLFVNARHARYIAEASTTYSMAPLFADVPQRILALSPNARFIYIMRDPIERTVSHYWHRANYWGETRPMLHAIRTDRIYTDVSHYAMQLQTYFRHVVRDRIYVLTYEALIADPIGQLSQVYRWLGVDPTVRPPKLEVPVNVMPEAIRMARGFGLLRNFATSTLYAKVFPWVPSLMRKLGSRLAFRHVAPREVPTAQVEAYLRPIQLRQTEALSALLQRSFAEWTTLHGTGKSIAFGSGQNDADVRQEGELRILTPQRIGRR
ncbi:MAG TPA: sulfotransferase [Burkholderiaceae bacterium]|nr:sulfotransferase [Burkholderiaceae bacterium]